MYRGVTIAVFHSLGITPVFNEKLIMKNSGYILYKYLIHIFQFKRLIGFTWYERFFFPYKITEWQRFFFQNVAILLNFRRKNQLWVIILIILAGHSDRWLKKTNFGSGKNRFNNFPKRSRIIFMLKDQHYNFS